jgi:hypothetical protein
VFLGVVKKPLIERLFYYVQGCTYVPVGNALGVRDDMDIKE